MLRDTYDGQDLAIAIDRMREAACMLGLILSDGHNADVHATVNDLRESDGIDTPILAVDLESARRTLDDIREQIVALEDAITF